MKNICLVAIGFFLCAFPLCAQEKTLDRMTRGEVKQKILQHMQIKDHVTFYHSNDKDIYVAYDLVNSGDKKGMLQGEKSSWAFWMLWTAIKDNPAHWRYPSLPAKSFLIPYACSKRRK